MQSYAEFLDLSVGFPQDGFEVVDDELYFHDINLMELVETFGTPLRFTYMPIISKKIQQAKLMFQKAMLKHNYRGSYKYAYCTKSSHFKHVLEEALKNDIHLETSSAFDMPIIEHLEKKGMISKDIFILCNGFKKHMYMQYIVDLIHDGFQNLIPILDNKEEFNFYNNELEVPCKLGIRIATEEKPDFPFYTSRLGIRYEDIIDFYNTRIKNNPNFKLILLHFFVNSGIRDTPYYWNELEKNVELYCRLKKVNPDLQYLDIGGGMPFKDSLTFDYDYEYMITEIINRIKQICTENQVEEPNLITEFGSYTVAESGGTLFKVIGRKQQNDREKWLMLDGSLMTTLPDIWALGQRFILLPLNNWDETYERVNIGGLTCDSLDYYNNDAHINSIFMPKTRKLQYIGFFHTGAYQETLSGTGGIHHCLMPTPRHVIIRKNRDETLSYDIKDEEQNSKQVLKILGYNV
ncbi:MAG: arginine decarboxylase [Bacteroidia bacterium]|nr:MAG: arginine decarboxylase [Bacteroidia bacterium]